MFLMYLDMDHMHWICYVLKHSSSIWSATGTIIYLFISFDFHLFILFINLFSIFSFFLFQIIVLIYLYIWGVEKGYFLSLRLPPFTVTLSSWRVLQCIIVHKSQYMYAWRGGEFCAHGRACWPRTIISSADHNTGACVRQTADRSVDRQADSRSTAAGKTDRHTKTHRRKQYMQSCNVPREPLLLNKHPFCMSLFSVFHSPSLSLY